MEKLNKKKKRKERGFSLIEVLLAVAILGLIAAPVLQMFYSSYAMNIKSKKYLAAADLAQSEMETISSRVWENSEAIVGGGEELGFKNDTLYWPTEETKDEEGNVIDVKIDNTKPIEKNNVSYAGYSFNTKITCIAPDNPPAGSYYTVEIIYEVFDSKNNAILSKTSTKIQNKR